MDRSASPRLRPGLVRDLERANPWWRGEPQRPLPATRRHLVEQIHRRLAARLAPIVVVRGLRQVGKTTAVRHVVQDLGKTLNQLAHEGGESYLVFDEVQGLRD